MFVEAHATTYTLDVNCRESKGILYDWVYLLVPLALDPKIVFENRLVCMNCGHPTEDTEDDFGDYCAGSP